MCSFEQKIPGCWFRHLHYSLSPVSIFLWYSVTLNTFFHPCFFHFPLLSLFPSLPFSLTVSLYMSCFSLADSLGPTGHSRLTITTVCQHRKLAAVGTATQRAAVVLSSRLPVTFVCVGFFCCCFEVFQASFWGEGRMSTGLVVQMNHISLYITKLVVIKS